MAPSQGPIRSVQPGRVQVDHTVQRPKGQQQALTGASQLPAVVQPIRQVQPAASTRLSLQLQGPWPLLASNSSWQKPTRCAQHWFQGLQCWTCTLNCSRALKAWLILVTASLQGCCMLEASGLRTLFSFVAMP